MQLRKLTRYIANLLQFVDLCILLGCDYLDPVPKVGPQTALKLIREHETLENFVAFAEKSKKFVIPEDWPYADARDLFFKPDVRPADHADCEFKWEAPDVDGLVQFLVTEKGFSEDRVRGGAARLQKNLKSGQQARLEGFFKPVPKTEEQLKNLKRKNDAKNDEKKKKLKEEKKEKKQAKAKPRGTAQRRVSFFSCLFAYFAFHGAQVADRLASLWSWGFN